MTHSQGIKELKALDEVAALTAERDKRRPSRAEISPATDRRQRRCGYGHLRRSPYKLLCLVPWNTFMTYIYVLIYADG